MKTVLAPNAPWPVVPEAKPKVVVVKKPRPVRTMSATSKIKHTNERYEQWAQKNLGEKA